MITVSSKQDFKHAILSGADEINVADPELAKWVVIAHAIKQTAWAIAIVLIAAGLYSMLATVGTAAPASALVSGLAASAVGVSGASAMVSLGLVLGGVSGPAL